MISEPTLPTAEEAYKLAMEAKEAKGLSRERISEDINKAIANGQTTINYSDADLVSELARKSLIELGYKITTKSNPFEIHTLLGFSKAPDMIVIDWSGQVPEPLAPPKNR